MIRLHFLLTILCLSSPNLLYANQKELTVAVASNFMAPMKELIQEFEKTTQSSVKVSFGSSGKFFAQIKNGAPYDVFFSADQEKPNALIEAGLANAVNLHTYAVGSLVLWSGTPNIDDQLESKLAHAKRIAIANPKLAPYGRAALEVLTGLGVKQSNGVRFIKGENIAQAFTFIRTGNVTLGLVAHSQVIQLPIQQRGSQWLIPQNLYQPIKQDVIILNTSRDNKLAQALLTFIKTNSAKKIIEQYGYQTL